MANRTFNVDSSPGSMNSSGPGCGNTGRACPMVNPNAFGASLSTSAMEEFREGVNAQSSPIQLAQGLDETFDLPMPRARATRVIKRTRVTRTSSDPDDPELQNNTFAVDAPQDRSHKSHGSSGPDSYDSYQGYHNSTIHQQTIPPMHKMTHRKNYDDNTSAPADFRMEPSTPRSPCYFPPSPLPDTPFQSSFRRGPLEHHITLGSDDRSYNSTRASPRSAYSPGYTPYTFMMDSGPPAYGRSFDPARVVIDPRTDNQSAPGRINASLMSRSGPGGYGNQTFDGTPSSRNGCQNVTCGSNKSGGSTGYHGGQSYSSPPSSDGTHYTSSGGSGSPDKSHHSVAWSPRQAGQFSYSSPSDATHYTSSGGSGSPDKSHHSTAWSPRQTGQFSYSSPSADGSYYTSEGSGSSGKPRGSSFPFSPRNAGHISGYNDSDATSPDLSRMPGQTLTPNSFNSNFRTPVRRRLFQSPPTPSPAHSISPPQDASYAGGFISQSLQSGPGAMNRSGRDRTQPPTTPALDYFSLIEDGNLTPTSKKKKVVRQTTSAGSMVSEECEEVYDIPEGFGTSPVGLIDLPDPTSFNPGNTSTPQGPFMPCLERSGIDPIASGMPYYVGRGNRSPQRDLSSTINESDINSTWGCTRANLSSTMNDSNFNTPRGRTRADLSSTMNDSDFRPQSSTINDSFYGSNVSGGKKGPCCCRKKGSKKGSPRNDSVGKESKCEDIGSPCKEQGSHLSNKSGGGSPDPVNVFQAGRYDIASEANATHSVAPVVDNNCICKGGNLSLDLQRIEQEEFSQLSRNLAQWQQSRRKVVSKMDSFTSPKSNSPSCAADCSPKS